MLSLLLLLNGSSLTMGELIGIATAGLGIMNLVMNLSISNKISQNELKTREWVDNSFVRAKEVAAKLKAIEGRQDNLEEQLESVRVHGCTRLADHRQNA